MTPLIHGELTIERALSGPTTLRLDWKGRSNFRHPGEVLTPFFNEVIEQARLGTAAVEMHFEDLEYLNSSTVAVLVQFLHKARTEGVPLRFLYRPSVRWQKLSFEALRVFEQLDRLVQVTPVPDAPPARTGTR